MTGATRPAEHADCPRCGGSIEAYTLGNQHAATCRDCGWVGVEATLPGSDEASAGESWDDALDRVSGRGVTTDRSETGLPPVVDEDHEEAAVALEDEVSLDAETPGSDTEGDGVESLAVIEDPDAEQLQAAGISTVDALAAADPTDLAAETAIAEADVRSYIRRAAIRSVTSGSRDE